MALILFLWKELRSRIIFLEKLVMIGVANVLNLIFWNDSYANYALG